MKYACAGLLVYACAGLLLTRQACCVSEGVLNYFRSASRLSSHQHQHACTHVLLLGLKRFDCFVWLPGPLVDGQAGQSATLQHVCKQTSQGSDVHYALQKGQLHEMCEWKDTIPTGKEGKKGKKDTHIAACQHIPLAYSDLLYADFRYHNISNSPATFRHACIKTTEKMFAQGSYN